MRTILILLILFFANSSIAQHVMNSDIAHNSKYGFAYFNRDSTITITGDTVALIREFMITQQKLVDYWSAALEYNAKCVDLLDSLDLAGIGARNPTIRPKVAAYLDAALKFYRYMNTHH